MFPSPIHNMDRPLDHWQQCADACDEGALGDHRRGHIALACCFQAGMALPWKKQHCIAKLPEKQQLIDKNITTFILETPKLSILTGMKF